MNKKQLSILKKLIAYIKPYNHYIIFTLISALFGVMFSLVTPILIGNAIDYIIAPGQVDYENIIKITICIEFIIQVGMEMNSCKWLQEIFISVSCCDIIIIRNSHSCLDLSGCVFAK